MSKTLFYPRNDLNVYDNKSAKLKFALSTNSSTWIKQKNKARMNWTLIWAIMSSLLYQLSYSLYLCINMRTKDLHLYLQVMSLLCYSYINPHLVFFPFLPFLPYFPYFPYLILYNVNCVKHCHLLNGKKNPVLIKITTTAIWNVIK